MSRFLTALTFAPLLIVANDKFLTFHVSDNNFYIVHRTTPSNLSRKDQLLIHTPSGRRELALLRQTFHTSHNIPYGFAALLPTHSAKPHLTPVAMLKGRVIYTFPLSFSP